MVPAAFVLILQQTLLMGMALLHAGRRLPSGRHLAATVLAYLALYLLWVGFTQILLPYLYGIPRMGDLATLLLIAVPFICACIAMGFALAAAIPWREGVVFFLVVMGMPLFFLSGISWSIEMIPAPLHKLSLLVPSSSAISAFVAVDQMGPTRVMWRRRSRCRSRWQSAIRRWPLRCHRSRRPSGANRRSRRRLSNLWREVDDALAWAD